MHPYDADMIEKLIDDKTKDMHRRVEILEGFVLTLSTQIRNVLGLEPISEQFQPPPLPPSVLPVEPPDPTWISVLHDRQRTDPSFPRPCGQVGVYLTEAPRENVKARMEVLRVLVPGEHRWRIPTAADEPRCSSCAAWIDPFSNSDLDYLSVMQPAPRSDAPIQSNLPPQPQKRRARRKPEVEQTQIGSPGSVESGLPPAFPAHTPRAREADEHVLGQLRDLAYGLGLSTTAD